MNDVPTRQEVAAQLAAVEAHTDTKFAQLIGEMRTGFAALNGRIDGLSGRVDGLSGRLDAVERSVSGIKITVIVTAIAAVAVVVAVLGYGQTWFGLGIGTRDIVRATVSELMQQQQQQAAAHPKAP